MNSISNNFIDRITSRFSTCVFLSPHLDDAAFSAGDLLLTLQAKKVNCVVVTFFTQIHSNLPTFSARMFLSQSGSTVATDLYKRRRDEDLAIFRSHGIEPIHLPLFDAMWRTKTKVNPIESILSKFLPEFIHLYPTYRLHIRNGYINPHDLTATQVSQAVATLHTQYPDALFFAPVGTGRHTDHLLVRDGALASTLPVIYWNDYPYSLHSKPDPQFVRAHTNVSLSFSNSWRHKRELISEYKTQVSAIFPNGIPDTGEETYYVPSIVDSLLGEIT